MNQYMVVCNGKRFATNADNMMEAETKFIETYGEFDDMKIYPIAQDIESDVICF